jgi:propanol-preferring alcohol dehydrogenase
MKAWQFTTVERGLELTDVPVPVPGPGRVLLAVTAAGLCHSDVGALEGQLHLPTTPVTMGHEIAGTVVRTGPDVEGWAPGERVAVTAGTGLGSVEDGGFAEYVAAPEELLVRVPDPVPDHAAAAATDAGLTAYHAVRTRGGVTKGDRVGIIGLGGLGLIGARVAVLAGATVYAADPKTDVHEVALQQGVTACATSITEFADKDLDVIVDFAGFDTSGDALHTVGDHGRVVQVGVSRPKATIDILDMLYKQIDFLGSVVGTTQDLAEVLELIGSGQLAPTLEKIDFDQVADGYERLRQGKVTGRLVAVL